MTSAQLTAVLSDINIPDHVFSAWFRPATMGYIVLKDNSILYINRNTMFYIDGTTELLYVATGITSVSTGVVTMPAATLIDQRCLDRVSQVIDFADINQIAMMYRGLHRGR